MICNKKNKTKTNNPLLCAFSHLSIANPLPSVFSDDIFTAECNCPCLAFFTVWEEGCHTCYHIPCQDKDLSFNIIRGNRGCGGVNEWRKNESLNKKSIKTLRDSSRLFIWHKGTNVIRARLQQCMECVKYSHMCRTKQAPCWPLGKWFSCYRLKCRHLMD